MVKNMIQIYSGILVMQYSSKDIRAYCINLCHSNVKITAEDIDLSACVAET